VFSGRFLWLSGADIVRTLNIQRLTLNIEIRGRVGREGAKCAEGQGIYISELNHR
jgi:hypothetical protein